MIHRIVYDVKRTQIIIWGLHIQLEYKGSKKLVILSDIKNQLKRPQEQYFRLRFLSIVQS